VAKKTAGSDAAGAATAGGGEAGGLWRQKKKKKKKKKQRQQPLLTLQRCVLLPGAVGARFASGIAPRQRGNMLLRRAALLAWAPAMPAMRAPALCRGNALARHR